MANHMLYDNVWIMILFEPQYGHFSFSVSMREPFYSGSILGASAYHNFVSGGVSNVNLMGMSFAI